MCCPFYPRKSDAGAGADDDNGTTAVRREAWPRVDIKEVIAVGFNSGIYVDQVGGVMYLSEGAATRYVYVLDLVGVFGKTSGLVRF